MFTGTFFHFVSLQSSWKLVCRHWDSGLLLIHYHLFIHSFKLLIFSCVISLHQAQCQVREPAIRMTGQVPRHLWRGQITKQLVEVQGRHKDNELVTFLVSVHVFTGHGMQGAGSWSTVHAESPTQELQCVRHWKKQGQGLQESLWVPVDFRLLPRATSSSEMAVNRCMQKPALQCGDRRQKTNYEATAGTGVRFGSGLINHGSNGKGVQWYREREGRETGRIHRNDVVMGRMWRYPTR